MTDNEVIEELQYAIDTGSLKVKHEETLIKAIAALKCDVDPQQTAGEWIHMKIPKYCRSSFKTFCSRCGFIIRSNDQRCYNFCPQCGSTMQMYSGYITPSQYVDYQDRAGADMMRGDVE